MKIAVPTTSPTRPTREGPAPRLMHADTLIGKNVYNLEGIELSDIKDIMLDVNAGSIAYVVLSCGGFIGIGDKLFAVPWKALKQDACITGSYSTWTRNALKIPARVRQESLAGYGGFDVAK